MMPAFAGMTDVGSIMRPLIKVKFFLQMMSSSGTGVIHSHLFAMLRGRASPRWLWITPPLPVVC